MNKKILTAFTLLFVVAVQASACGMMDDSPPATSFNDFLLMWGLFSLLGYFAQRFFFSAKHIATHMARGISMQGRVPLSSIWSRATITSLAAIFCLEVFGDGGPLLSTCMG